MYDIRRLLLIAYDMKRFVKDQFHTNEVAGENRHCPLRLASPQRIEMRLAAWLLRPSRLVGSAVNVLPCPKVERVIISIVIVRSNIIISYRQLKGGYLRSDDCKWNHYHH